MGRLTDKLSAALEDAEGDLSLLGNSLVYIRMVIERIEAAQKVTAQQHLLAPGIDDLVYAYRQIRMVQDRIIARRSSSPPAQDNPETSSEKTHIVHQTALCTCSLREKGSRG